MNYLPIAIISVLVILALVLRYFLSPRCESCGTRNGVEDVHGHKLCGVCERDHGN